MKLVSVEIKKGEEESKQIFERKILPTISGALLWNLVVKENKTADIYYHHH